MRVHRRLIEDPAEGEGGALNPNSLTGWIAIHDSRSITPLVDNTNMTDWPDTSGNARHALPYLGFTGAYRTGGGPAATTNAQPQVELIGNRTMVFGLPAAGTIDTTGGWSAMLYMQQTGLTLGQRLYWSGTAENFELYVPSLAGNWPYLGVDGAPLEASGVAMTTGFHIIEAHGIPPRGLAAGGVTQVYVDAVLAGQSASAGWMMRPNTEHFFSEVTAGSSHRIAWAGYRALLLTAGQRAGIRAWLMDQFGSV